MMNLGAKLVSASKGVFRVYVSQSLIYEYPFAPGIPVAPIVNHLSAITQLAESSGQLWYVECQPEGDTKCSRYGTDNRGWPDDAVVSEAEVGGRTVYVHNPAIDKFINDIIDTRTRATQPEPADPRFICTPCKNGEHCGRTDTWCDCQHR